MSDNLREFFRQHGIELNRALKEKLDEYGVERVSDIALLTEQELKQAGKLNIESIPYTVKLQILAILANGIKTLILIPANNYNQSCGRTR